MRIDTVQDLINILMQVEDKDKDLYFELRDDTGRNFREDLSFTSVEEGSGYFQINVR